MKEFEYGEQKQRYEKMKKRALAGGLKQYQIDSALIPEDFGREINNDFPQLSDEEKIFLEFIYTNRELAINEREQVIRVMNQLIQREERLSSEIDEMNKKICGIQGHRLDEESLRPTKTYGFSYTCLVCGQLIRQGMITDKDVLVKNSNVPKRIRYKK